MRLLWSGVCLLLVCRTVARSRPTGLDGSIAAKGGGGPQPTRTFRGDLMGLKGSLNPEAWLLNYSRPVKSSAL